MQLSAQISNPGRGIQKATYLFLDTEDIRATITSPMTLRDFFPSQLDLWQVLRLIYWPSVCSFKDFDRQEVRAVWTEQHDCWDDPPLLAAECVGSSDGPGACGSQSMKAIDMCCELDFNMMHDYHYWWQATKLSTFYLRIASRQPEIVTRRSRFGLRKQKCRIFRHRNCVQEITTPCGQKNSCVLVYSEPKTP